MPVIGNLLSSLFTIVADNKRCITNVLILVLTTVAHEIIDVTTFECPCISSIELKAGNSNYWYGVAYLVAPAIILFLVGISLSVDIWKWLTGCCTRFCRVCCDSENEKSCSRQHCTAALLFWTRVVAVALLAPAVWLSVSLLDGDAMACALTSSPYTFSESQTCADISDLNTTDDYNDNKLRIQTIGWIVIAAVCFVATLLYMITRCLSRKTYYHRMYHENYRRMEEEAIENEIYDNEKAKREIKIAAKNIVQKFGGPKRNSESNPTPEQFNSENQNVKSLEVRKWNKVLDLFLIKKDVHQKRLKDIELLQRGDGRREGEYQRGNNVEEIEENRC
ncbi:calcium homeostasis modulator protein 6-like [Clavelina lepadiformis]|uniref:calcium homeostasis modulator protein 6-like n=1 Tax=Clavelina lepadiformis TaxID=159417 RepID=UPI004042CF43